MSPTLTSGDSPLEKKYSELLNKTCATALKQIPTLPAAGTTKFMQAYTSFNGSNSEADVIKYANSLLNRKDVQTFLGRPDSFVKGGPDASLVLCSVLIEATPVGLANFTAQGKTQEELVDNLLANPVLMRDFLVAGGATNGMYGQAMSIYTDIVKASSLLSSTKASSDPDYWDDRSQNKQAILRRLAIGTALEHAVPIKYRFKQSVTPAWGPTWDPTVGIIDPVKRYLHYENAYVSGDLDPAFEVLTAFEMRHVSNADAVEPDLTWMRDTMAIYSPDAIAMNYSVGRDWRYAETVHHDVPYTHHHCPNENYTAICSGHYSMIPALGGICGYRAFFGRITRQAFGLPTWGLTEHGHAAMTSWNPAGWNVMLGATWPWGWWGKQSGVDFHLEVQAREVRASFQKVLRGDWAALARGDAPAGTDWVCAKTCRGFGIGGLWSALMLYQKKAVVNSTSPIPTRPIGPAAVPSKVAALIAKWDTPVPIPKVTADAHGTITVPAAAYSRALTTGRVAAMKSLGKGEQLMTYGGDLYNASSTVFAYEVPVASAGAYYLTANHSTWHVDQDLIVTVNGGTDKVNLPVYYTMGYWNETQALRVTLTKGVNTITFMRYSTQQISIKEFFLYKTKPVIPGPPSAYKPRPITPPPPASEFILEPSSTSCQRQGIEDVPEDLCKAACTETAHRTYTGAKSTTGVSGCFAIMEGKYIGNCNYNSNKSASCTPPCRAGGPKGSLVGEICLRK